MTTVPKYWPASTVVCIASGPSLVSSDVDFVGAARADGMVRVIAINDNYRLAPWADALYACDDRWWQRQYQDHATAIASFAGLRFCMEPGDRPGQPSRAAAVKPEWRVGVLRNTGREGLELEPTGLRTGKNSGYQAINLAVHLGARRIVLLGYDMSLGRGGQHHWFGKHWHGGPPQLTKFRLHFPTIAAPLRALGIEVLNCSRRSALTCFPKVPLEIALQREAA